MNQKTDNPLSIDPSEPEDIRSGLSPSTIARAFSDNLAYLCARFPEVATLNDSLRRSGWPTKEVSLTSWVGLLTLGQVAPVGRNLTYLDPSSSFRRRGSRLRWQAGRHG